MPVNRSLAILATVALALTLAVREHARQSSAEAAAMTLIAEATALCEIGLPEPRAARPGAARRGAGREALAAAGEIGERLRDRRLASILGELTEAVRPGCAEVAGRRSGQDRPVRVEPARDRRELIEPFLARLNRAAVEAANSEPEPAVASFAGRSRRPSPPESTQASGPEKTATVAALPIVQSAGEPAGQSSRPSKSASGTSPEPADPQASVSERGMESASRPAIQVSIGASREHRRKISRWVLVFGREAEAIRVARRELQAEIETRTMARCFHACRTFGRALERVNPELTAAAPYRELARRSEVMLSNYRRGVRECERGRTAAAFSYLSEGDRAWVGLVRDSRRMAQPRPAGGRP